MKIVAEVNWRTAELLITLEATGRGEGFRQVIFTASRSGFTAAREAFIDDDDLELFIAGIERMSTTLAGQAELLGDYGTESTLRLTMLPGGHVKVYVEVNHTFAELHIEDETDQTCLASATHCSLWSDPLPNHSPASLTNRIEAPPASATLGGVANAARET